MVEYISQTNITQTVKKRKDIQMEELVFQTHEDNHGILVAVQEYKEIPFSIKRIYYIYDISTDTIRGHHAHKSLQQVLICVHGRCMLMLDDGTEQKVVSLDKPNKGIYIPNIVWREIFDFSSDAVLLVLASDFYKETDYIRTYDEFLEYIKSINGDSDENEYPL